MEDQARHTLGKEGHAEKDFFYIPAGEYSYDVVLTNAVQVLLLPCPRKGAGSARINKPESRRPVSTQAVNTRQPGVNKDALDLFNFAISRVNFGMYPVCTPRS